MPRFKFAVDAHQIQQELIELGDAVAATASSRAQSLVPRHVEGTQRLGHSGAPRPSAALGPAEELAQARRPF